MLAFVTFPLERELPGADLAGLTWHLMPVEQMGATGLQDETLGMWPKEGRRCWDNWTQDMLGTQGDTVPWDTRRWAGKGSRCP